MIVNFEELISESKFPPGPFSYFDSIKEIIIKGIFNSKKIKSKDLSFYKIDVDIYNDIKTIIDICYRDIKSENQKEEVIQGILRLALRELLKMYRYKSTMVGDYKKDIYIIYDNYIWYDLSINDTIEREEIFLKDKIFKDNKYKFTIVLKETYIEPMIGDNYYWFPHNWE